MTAPISANTAKAAILTATIVEPTGVLNKIERIIPSAEQSMKERSVSLMSYSRDENAFALSFSGISIEKLEDGVRILSEILSESAAT